MCNILILPPYGMPVREKFENMCYNNWHSWGIVTRIDGKLDVVKKVPASGEIDAEEIEVIWKLLERDQEFERILHVRHNTAGATSLDNCHPYDVFYDPSNGRQVLFMHNGTMYEYKSKITVPNQWNTGFITEDDPDGLSDSKNFVDQILTPMLCSQDYGEGHGDVNSKFFIKLIGKLWPSGNRGLIIPNDQNLVFLGEWKKIKGENDIEIWSSNDDYFHKVTRGPESQRREEREKKAREAERARAFDFTASGSNGVREITPLSSFNFNKHSIYNLTCTLDNITYDWTLWDRDTAVSIGGATRDELEALHSDKESCLTVMDWIFGDYYELYQDYNDLEDKHKRQATYINQLHGKLRAAGIDNDILSMDNNELADMVILNTKAA